MSTSKLLPNTVIGGVGATITTREQLASKLSLTAADIRTFEIIGSDVYANIRRTYSIASQVFQNDMSITSYIDRQGLCTIVNLQAFSNSSVIDLYLPNAYLLNSALYQTPNLTNINFNGDYTTSSTSLGFNSIRQTKLKRIVAPYCETITDYAVKGSTELLDIVAPLRTIGANAINGCSKLNINLQTLSTVTSLGGSAMIGVGQEYLIMPNLTIVSGQSLRNMNKVVEAKFAIVAEINDLDYLFQNWSSCGLIEMKKLKVFGNSATASTTCFNALKLNCEIRVNLTLATSNAGSANATLLWAKTNRSAVIKFYDDAGNYISTL